MVGDRVHTKRRCGNIQTPGNFSKHTAVLSAVSPLVVLGLLRPDVPLLLEPDPPASFQNSEPCFLLKGVMFLNLSTEIIIKRLESAESKYDFQATMGKKISK